MIARITRIQNSSAQGLACELVIFQRYVVLKLLNLQYRVAVFRQVVHVDLVCGPNALIVANVCVVSSPYELFFVVVFDLCKRVVVFSDPEIGVRVLRNLGLFWRRLNFPTRGSINWLLSKQFVVILIAVPLLEIFETE